MSNPNPNTANMLEYSKLRTEQATNKVNVAISQMLKDNIPVNFNSVSEHAGVSKRFLYSQAKIKEKIVMLRSQPCLRQLPPVKASLNESSKDVIISRQKLKIQGLNDEISKLRNELQILYGKLALYQTK
jgi:hypothetical protein